MVKVMVEKLPDYFELDWDVFKEENPDAKDGLEAFEVALRKYVAVEDREIRKNRRKKDKGVKGSRSTKANRVVDANETEDEIDVSRVLTNGQERGRQDSSKQDRGRPQRREHSQQRNARSKDRRSVSANTTQGGRCHNCKKEGHVYRNCPDLQCYNCKLYGHIAEDCKEPRRSSQRSRSRESRFRSPNSGRKNRQIQKPANEILVQNVSYKTTTILEARGSDNKWIKIDGCLDSGAGRTVGGYQQHKKLCGMIKSLTTPMVVKVGDQRPITVKAVGQISLRVHVDDVAPVYLGDVQVFLLDCDTWKELLIGREVLSKFQSLPEDIFRSLPSDARKMFGSRSA